MNVRILVPRRKANRQGKLMQLLSLCINYRHYRRQNISRGIAWEMARNTL